MRVPDTGDLGLWLIAQPFGTVLYPCESLDALAKKVVILGQGPIGLTFTQVLSAMMPSVLVAVDLQEYRLSKALELGADVTTNPATEDVTRCYRPRHRTRRRGHRGGDCG